MEDFVVIGIKDVELIEGILDSARAVRAMKQTGPKDSDFIETITAPDESIRPATVTPAPVNLTGFNWGKKSLAELNGVKPELRQCATLALTRYSRIDFMCFDGIRTIEEQRKYVAAGTSKTMKSKHLDGLAVDLVPVIGGVPKWDWVALYEVAYAMDRAAHELKIEHSIRWGGAWDRTLADFGGDASAYAKEVQLYQQRHAGPDFIDGPHFEWVE